MNEHVIEVARELAKGATLDGKVLLRTEQLHMLNALVANGLAYKGHELADLSGNYYIHLTKKALNLRTVSR